MDAIEKLYAYLPTIACRGLCAESCGPIVFSQLEADRMARKGVPEPAFDTTATCNQLRAGRCAIYKNRPLVCRLFGLTKSMRCRHGCVPSRWLEPEEEDALMRALGPLRQRDYELLEAIEKESTNPGDTDADRV